MSKLGRPRRNKIYFDEAVQEAIIEYNAEENHIVRNKLYREKIHYALEKLCENIINTFKFSYFDAGFKDVKQEVLSFLIMNMHKYDGTKGYKAFSYFSVVAKNYLIAVNNSNYRKLITHSEISTSAPARRLVAKPDHDKEGRYNTQLMEEIVKYFEGKIPNMFRKKRDLDIAWSVLELLKRRHEIDNYNKKSLYILIREMTGVDTVYITKVVNEMKKHYGAIAREYSKTGDISRLSRTRFFM
tara:strand:- start:6596 stop:7321 length:726 start_codon:yes stop_codon:yes gene_type:complete